MVDSQSQSRNRISTVDLKDTCDSAKSSEMTRLFYNSPVFLEQFTRQFAFPTDGEASSGDTDCTAPMPCDDECRDDLGSSNICPDCHSVMDTQGDEYVCHCGRIVCHVDSHLTSDSSLRGGRDMRHYYGSSDPMKTQRTGVYDCLVAYREKYLMKIASRRGIPYDPSSSLVDGGALSEFAPSLSVLANVAKIYNDIQRAALKKGTQFIRRRDVRNEIIAAILSMECGKGDQMNKKEISEMMGLRTEGFSRGHEQLLLQSADGNIILDCDAKICENTIMFYYKKTLGAYLSDQFMATKMNPNNTLISALELLRDTDDELNLRFIRKIVNSSIKHHIGVQSQLQSKIVGTIWFIILAMRYPITTQRIDIMSGGIKKGTFLKFSRTIIKSARLRRMAKKHFPQLTYDGAVASLGL